MEERYEIKEKIGHGGLGTVYKAFDSRMNRDIAIKRIRTISSDGDISFEAADQLLKEAGALASLQHPNIVTIYDIGNDEDGPYVVMELLTGETLEDIVTRGSLTWEDFRQLAYQIMEALIAAHELNLIHRDIKPSNIMVTWLPSGKLQIKIVDFGLAKLTESPIFDQPEGVFGSIYFMAPEQFERLPLDHRIDLYAVGCVFYYALTGSYPFDGDSAANVMAAHINHDVTPIQNLREGLPMWACDWIMWHINRYASNRPESPRDSLKLFLENETQPTIAYSKGRQIKIISSPHIGTSLHRNSQQNNSIAQYQAVPIPLIPPLGSKPSVHTSTQQVHRVSQPTLSNEMKQHESLDHQLKSKEKIILNSKKVYKIDKITNNKIKIKTASPLLINNKMPVPFNQKKSTSKKNTVIFSNILIIILLFIIAVILIIIFY